MNRVGPKIANPQQITGARKRMDPKPIAVRRRPIRISLTPCPLATVPPTPPDAVIGPGHTRRFPWSRDTDPGERPARLTHVVMKGGPRTARRLEKARPTGGGARGAPRRGPGC